MPPNATDERPAAMAEQLVIRLTTEERDALAERAIADDRPLASYCRRVLRGHLDSTAEVSPA